jgi:xylose isomerase
VLDGKMSLDAVATHVVDRNTDTMPVSGRQELLENLLNSYI